MSYFKRLERSNPQNKAQAHVRSFVVTQRLLLVKERDLLNLSMRTTERQGSEPLPADR